MKQRENNRRDFIRKAVMGSILITGIPDIVSAVMPPARTKKIMLEKENIILFQGDSITDSGRNKEDEGYNNPRILGTGYPLLAGAALLKKYAGLNLKIYNRGISGNKVYQLADRWDKDCIDLKPDIVSILIGVNDIWHKLNGNYNGTVDIYRRDYIALLERTKKSLPGVQLIVCEPFGVKDVRAVDERWYPEFYEYQKTAREIADMFGAVFVPFQKIYDEAQKYAPGSYWTGDGVHPTLAGAELMAEAWLQVIK